MLLGETCSKRTLIISVPPLSERKQPVECCHALHVQRAHLQMLLWKAADKSDPPDVQMTGYGWEVNEHEHVMPAISREPAAPSKLMNVLRCSGNEECKVFSGRCSYGMSSTSYCVREGGMLAVTHILNGGGRMRLTTE